MTKNNPKTIFISSLLLLATSACAQTETSDADIPRAKLIELEPVPEVVAPIASTPTTTTSPSTIDEIRAAADAVKNARPEFFAELDSQAAQHAPNGMPRFGGPKIQDPDAGVIFAARLLDEASADSATRSALADVLGRSAGDFGPMAVAILGVEQDAEVRRTLTMSLRRASDASALVGLTLALADQDARVRADAAYCAASHPGISALLEPLRAGLSDDSPVARAASARALGVLKDRASATSLVAMVADEDAEIRLQALRAIKRIDTSLLSEVDLGALREDGDMRIAREADKLSRLSN